MKDEYLQNVKLVEKAMLRAVRAFCQLSFIYVHIRSFEFWVIVLKFIKVVVCLLFC